MARNYTSLTQTVTKDPKVISELREAFGRIYDENSRVIPGKEEESKAFLQEIHSPEVGIPETLPIKDTGILIEYLYETQTPAPEYSEGTTTMAGAPETTAVSNTLTPDQLKTFEEENEKIQGKLKETRESTAVQDAINRKIAIYNEQIKKAEAAAKKKEGEKVYLKTKENEEKIAEDQKKAIEGLKEEIKKNPIEAIPALEKEIRSRVDDNVPDEAVAWTAVGIVNNTVYKNDSVKKTEIAQAFLKEPEFSWASPYADQSKSLVDLEKEITASAFGNGSDKEFFPDVAVSQTPAPDYEPFTTTFLPPVSLAVLEVQKQRIENPKLEAYLHNNLVEQQLARLEAGGFQGGTSNMFVTYFETIKQGPQMTFDEPAQARFNMAAGMEPGMAGRMVGGFVKDKIKDIAVKKISGTIAGKVGASIATKAVVGAVAVEAAPETLGLSLIVGAVINKALDLISAASRWLKENNVAELVPALLFGGLMLPFGLQAGLGSFIVSFGGLKLWNSTPAGRASFGTGIGNFFGALGGAALGGIGPPILFTLLGFPVVVALILFIINSGAYVVPPGTQSLDVQNENPYVDVQKTASPAGPFQNSDLPLKVTYTITVSAKTETLSNVLIKDTCTVISKAGNQGCSAVGNNPPGGTINVGTPFSFTYDSTYTSSYKDSLVLNDVSVTANVLSQTAPQTADGGTSITIGTPPTGCLTVDQKKWPTNAYNNIMYAVTKLTTDFSSYTTKVCSSYTSLPLQFAGGGDGAYWGRNFGTYINFYPLGVKDKASALYTLSHELGHSLAGGAKTAFIYAAYKAYPGIKTEAPYCFYKDTIHWNSGESMPESIALYVLNGVYPGECPSVQQKWPKHYQFLKKYVFN